MKCSVPALLLILLLIPLLSGCVGLGLGVSPSPEKVQAPEQPVLKLRGMIGSEKAALFRDAAFRRIAADKYGMELEWTTAGSYEMAGSSDLTSYDFVFPASLQAADLIKEKVRYSAAEELLRTPLVYYSWSDAVESLIAGGMVRPLADGSLGADTEQLIRLALEGRRWEEMKVPGLSGPIVIASTDPLKSNSGSSFAALAAASLNGGEPVTEEAMSRIAGPLRQLLEHRGLKKSSTTELFDEYMEKGPGMHKLIVGYESDLLHYSREHSGSLGRLEADSSSAQPVMLYPQPTVWSVHELVALNERAEMVIELFRDPEVQQLAWERFGFRTRYIGGAHGEETFAVRGISRELEHVVPLPDYRTMQALQQLVAEQP